MSRRRAAIKREVLPDHKFKDKILTKFMNRIMLDGKKSVSERIVYGAFDIVFSKTNKKPTQTHCYVKTKVSIPTCLNT